MKTFRKMIITEFKLSLRGMDMFIFAIIMPILILIVLGFIHGDKPAFEGATYTVFEQSFGAISSISILAGGIMGLPIVISDYRSKKILKRLQVTPVNPIMILTVQVVIYTIYSFLSLILLFIIATIFFGLQIQGSVLLFLLGWILVMVSMFSIGMMVGGVAKDQKTANIIASVLYFPMLVFSGATVPYEVMPIAMQTVVDMLPLTQGIKLLKSTSLGLPVENILLPGIVMLVIAFTSIVISIKFFKWE